MSKEVELFEIKIRLKEWAKFESLVRDLINAKIDYDDIWDRCFEEKTKLNNQIEQLND